MFLPEVRYMVKYRKISGRKIDEILKDREARLRQMAKYRILNERIGCRGFAVEIALILALGVVGQPWDAAAGEPVRLTRDGQLKRDPVFLPGGKELVFTLLESPVQLRLMKLKLADGSVEPLHPNVTKSEFEPAFSADGRYIAFVQSRGNLSLALVIRDRMQKSDSEVRPAGGFSGMRSPAISPDGSRVLYCFPDDGRQQIYSVNLKATDRKLLTNSGGINNWPCFSSDGKRIVFGSTRDEGYELYVMNSDGGAVRRITSSPRQDIRPRFSPDGKRIAFTSSRDGNYEIYVINADGSRPQRITNHEERDDFATWHPDGRRLVVVSEREGRHDLYLVDVPK